MTNVIQTLADQAKEKVPDGLVVNDWVAEYNKAFAKLVIDECVSVMRDQEKIPAGFIQSKNTDIHEVAINNHFGITLSKKEKFQQAVEEALKDGVDLSGKETP